MCSIINGSFKFYKEKLAGKGSFLIRKFAEKMLYIHLEYATDKCVTTTTILTTKGMMKTNIVKAQK